MSERGVAVIGLGKRVREAVLPALARCEGRLRVVDVYARSARSETVAGRDFAVRPIDELDERALEGVDLVYLAVGKDAVPGVLARLSRLDTGRLDLLIDTPVVRFKHFRHARLLDSFRNAWVPEDCAYLPWFDLVSMAAQSEVLGTPRHAHFERSAYAYHGLASGKALLGAGRVVRGVRRTEGSGSTREIILSSKGEAPTGSISGSISGADGAPARRRLTVTEPRDYSLGWVRIEGEHGAVSDRVEANPGATALEAEFASGTVTGLRCGPHHAEFDDDERALTAGVETGQSIIAMQEAMKRVGLLRLLRSVHAGNGGYSVAEGLDDMVVDYHLEKFRRYRANPFTSARSPLARALLSAVSRVAGR